MGKQILDETSNIKIETNNSYDSKKIITEKDLTNFSSKGGDTLILPKGGSILTPLARDKAKELGINIEIKG